MKKTFFGALIGLCAFALTACEPNNPTPTPTPDPEPEKQDTVIPSSFPKKHLLEEFTGQGCGYCPGGMDAIHEFMGNDTNWVLILHHSGYAADNFTIPGNSKISTALGVSGAPSMDIDRATTNYGDGKAVVFHPGYLEMTNKSQFSTETYASIKINNEYDPSTRELYVNVSGLVVKEDHPDLKVTVLVKESGMIDTQADYYNTYEGWQEFRHANAVRAFLTDPKGDAVTVTNQRYSDIFSVKMKEEWVAENCMVVVFLSEGFKPVIQAEQKPVVEGTKGGADIKHGGITRVPVSDYYPEPDPDKGPADYTGTETETMSVAQAQYVSYSENGFNFWQINTYNAKNTVNFNGTACLRHAQIYLFTGLDETTIPEGTYDLNLSLEPGTAYAGFRDDEESYIGGSTFYFINKSYYSQGYLVPEAQWLLAEGTMTVSSTGWELRGHTLNGASIHLEGTTPIVNKGRANAPLKAPGRRTDRKPAIEYCK